MIKKIEIRNSNSYTGEDLFGREKRIKRKKKKVSKRELRENKEKREVNIQEKIKNKAVHSDEDEKDD